MKNLVSGFMMLLLVLTASCVLGQRRNRNRIPLHLTKMTIQVGTLERTYYLFRAESISKKKEVPLLFVFHGGGGNPLSMDRRLGFTQIARKEGFIVVYPEGVGGNWNDGRKTQRSRAHRENIDDLGFVDAIIRSVSAEYGVDQKRIYATGPSNGGIFSHYVGANLSEKFAAIAPVIGGITDPFHKQFLPKWPVSVFIVQGTDDKLVAYDGARPIARNRGKVIATEAAVELWKKNNGTDSDSINGALPDIDRHDGCTVETYLWRNGKRNTEVKLFKLIGGGHTWAGGQQYLPKIIIGNVCRDFSATEVIWQFFREHPKP